MFFVFHITEVALGPRVVYKKFLTFPPKNMVSSMPYLESHEI